MLMLGPYIHRADLILFIENRKKSRVLINKRWLDILSVVAKDCMCKMLHTKTPYRYTASEVLLCPWISVSIALI